MKCPYNCQKQITYGTAKTHVNEECPNMKIQCKFCHERFSKQQLIMHVGSKHQYETRKCLEDLHNPNLQRANTGQTAPTLRDMTNDMGNKAYLGRSGKYCCDRNTTYGTQAFTCTFRGNCTSCMRLDIRRLNLPKGFLLNTQGVVAKIDSKKTGKFFCGVHTAEVNQHPNHMSSRVLNVKQCSEEKPCNACKQLSHIFTYPPPGIYKELV